MLGNLVLVAVMQIRHVRVLVLELLVRVRVGMADGGGHPWVDMRMMAVIM